MIWYDDIYDTFKKFLMREDIHVYIEKYVLQFMTIKVYQGKLALIRKEMINIHERTAKLKVNYCEKHIIRKARYISYILKVKLFYRNVLYVCNK